MFGITRTNRVSAPSNSASCFSVMPAAIDTTRCFAEIVAAASGSTALIICGFTASTRTSAAAITSAFEFVARIPVVA